jgi:polysaccharide biosynthesis/export protein
LVVCMPAFCQTAPQEANAKALAQTGRNELVLGPGDQLTVAAPDIDELDHRQLKVLADGTVSVPLAGPIKAAGLTADEFCEKLNQALTSQFRNPRVSFTQIDTKSRPVTVLGAVNNPGVIQADGRKRLLEVISIAGGLRNDAGPTLTITRKPSQATQFPSALRPALAGNYVVATVSVDGLMEGTDPASNILVYPGDIVTVPKGRLVYVIGDVNRPGGFMIGESNDLTVLKAVSLSQGLRDTADPSHARILRSDASGKRTEQELNVKKLLAGKLEDVNLKANDILFIPSSLRKRIADRSIGAMIDTGAGVAVYRQ